MGGRGGGGGGGGGGFMYCVFIRMTGERVTLGLGQV